MNIGFVLTTCVTFLIILLTVCIGAVILATTTKIIRAIRKEDNTKNETKEKAKNIIVNKNNDKKKEA